MHHVLCHRLAVLALAFGAVSAGTAVSADGHRPDDHELARQALERGQVLPLRTVIDRVEQQYHGQVIKVEFEREDGLFVYDIRLLQSDGRLVKLELDARDGRLIKMKRKD